MIKVIAAVVCGMVILGGEASAQVLAWKDWGFVNVSGGTQIGSKDVSHTFAFPLYDETATVTIARKAKQGPFFDITGARRLKGNFGVGVSVSRSSSSSDGALTASIPDPIETDKPRTVTGDLTSLDYKVTWIGVLGVYALPVTDKVDVFALVGPAVARVTQTALTNATVTESTPAPLVTVTRGTSSNSFLGFQAGLDVRYLITKQIGVGGFARFNFAKGNVNPSTKFDGKAFQVGGGIRVRF